MKFVDSTIQLIDFCIQVLGKFQAFDVGDGHNRAIVTVHRDFGWLRSIRDRRVCGKCLENQVCLNCIVHHQAQLASTVGIDVVNQIKSFLLTQTPDVHHKTGIEHQLANTHLFIHGSRNKHLAIAHDQGAAVELNHRVRVDRDIYVVTRHIKGERAAIEVDVQDNAVAWFLRDQQPEVAITTDFNSIITIEQADVSEVGLFQFCIQFICRKVNSFLL